MKRNPTGLSSIVVLLIMVIAMLTAMSSSLCAAGNIEAGIAEETTVATPNKEIRWAIPDLIIT